MKYRKKPVVIEAFCWTGGPDQVEDPEWICAAISAGSVRFENPGTPEVALLIDTLEGTHRANRGDFIIKGVAGELYPCKPEIFAATYDPVEGPIPDKAPAAPIEPPAAVSLRRVEELIRYHKGRHTPWTPITADTATALEALVRVVEAGWAIQSFEAAMGNPALARGWCDEGEAFNAALAQFTDDREKKP